MSILVRKVRIRAWHSMRKQEGASEDMFGHIEFKGTHTRFTGRMSDLCGKTIEIQRIGVQWYTMDSTLTIIKQMVIPSHRKRLDMINQCCICGNDILDSWAYEKVKAELSSANTIIINEYVCTNCCSEDIKKDGTLLKIIRARGRTI